MNKMTLYAFSVGVVIYIVVIYLAFIQRDLTGPQLILMLVAPFLVGFLSRGFKKGLSNGFLLSFIMLLLESLIIQSGAFTDPNVAMAVILMMVLPFAALSAVLGAAGGFLGSHVLKKALKS